MTDNSERDCGEEPCSPNGFGLCSTHPVCEYMRASLHEWQEKAESLGRENRRLRRLYIETAERLEETIKQLKRTAAWMRSAEQNT